MATKIKGICSKGVKYIAQIFVVKERVQREMEIGYPTDVKHVAHIGWDGGASGNTPSWMKEFKSSSEYSSKSVPTNTTDFNAATSPWSSQDFDELMGHPSSHSFSGVPSSDLPKIPKKQKKKKKKSSNSPTSSSSSSRTSRSTLKSRLNAMDQHAA